VKGGKGNASVIIGVMRWGRTYNEKARPLFGGRAKEVRKSR